MCLNFFMCSSFTTCGHPFIYRVYSIHYTTFLPLTAPLSHTRHRGLHAFFTRVFTDMRVYTGVFALLAAAGSSSPSMLCLLCRAWVSCWYAVVTRLKR